MKIIKRIAIWLGIALFFLFIASVVIAIVFEDEIGQELVNQINKELVSDMKVEKFRLSLIKGFPNVNADLQNIVVPDNHDGILLEAKSMSFKMGLIGLLTSNIKLKTVLIENGALFVQVNRNGKANYFINKPSKQDIVSAQMNFALSLDEAILKDIELIYIDERGQARNEVTIRRCDFLGKI